MRTLKPCLVSGLFFVSSVTGFAGMDLGRQGSQGHKPHVDAVDVGHSISDLKKTKQKKEATMKDRSPEDARLIPIRVHYDYMVANDGHTHLPDPKHMKNVVKAYRDQGFDLILDTPHAIPETLALNLSWGPEHPDYATLLQLKERHHTPGQLDGVHYGVFAHYLGCLPDDWENCQWGVSPWTSGIAELPGMNFIVSHGFEQDFLAGGYSVDPVWKVGTFMHELGHNLGLRHGGANDDNYKPNYISVMNYMYQFGVPQIKQKDFEELLDSYYNGTETSIFEPKKHGKPGYDSRLDYSNRVNPTLDEGESDGHWGCMGTQEFSSDTVRISSSGKNDLFSGLGSNGDLWVNYIFNNRSKFIDFNMNQLQDIVPISMDLNSDGFCSPLQGFDDWSYLRNLYQD